MTNESAAKWISDNCTATENHSYNGIDYKFCTMHDGWIAIFKVTDAGQLVPAIQAKDMEHAEDFCIKREATIFPMTRM